MSRANPNRGRNGSTSWIRKSTRFAIYHRDGWRCAFCVRAVHPGTATLDHIRPESRGGTHASTNLTTACGRCNSSRRAMPLRTFIQKSGLAQFVGVEAIARNIVARARRPIDRDVGLGLARAYGWKR